MATYVGPRAKMEFLSPTGNRTCFLALCVEVDREACELVLAGMFRECRPIFAIRARGELASLCSEQ